MSDLKTTYQNDSLDTTKNTERVFNIVDSSGNVVKENVHFVDKTVYTQEGDQFGAEDINETNAAINNLNSNLELKVDGFTDGDYTKVTGLAYDSTNKKLGLKVGASTEIIPFNSTPKEYFLKWNKTNVSSDAIIGNLETGTYSSIDNLRPYSDDFFIIPNTNNWNVYATKNGTYITLLTSYSSFGSKPYMTMKEYEEGELISNYNGSSDYIFICVAI